MVVSASWLAASCRNTSAHTAATGLDATNAIDTRLVHRHHPVWRNFLPWRGFVTKVSVSENLTDFMGFVAPRSLYCNPAYMRQPRAHALRARQCGFYLPAPVLQRGVELQTVWPVVSEEYFEYCDVLSAVLDYTEEVNVNGSEAGSRRPFVFVELGAGYGHWTFTAHKALMQLAPAAPYRYLMADVVPSLEKAVRNLERLNGVSPEAATFHVGYIGAHDSAMGEGRAQVRDGALMIKAYSKLWGTGTSDADSQAIKRTVSLRSLLEMYSLPACVDMLDIDVQGSEYASFRGHQGIFYGTSSIEVLNSRVRRVHIGTHVGPDFSRQLQNLVALFQENHWKKVWDFSPGERVTPWGPVDFGDGVVSFVNQNPSLVCPLT